MCSGHCSLKHEFSYLIFKELTLELIDNCTSGTAPSPELGVKSDLGCTSKQLQIS